MNAVSDSESSTGEPVRKRRRRRSSSPRIGYSRTPSRTPSSAYASEGDDEERDRRFMSRSRSISLDRVGAEDERDEGGRFISRSRSRSVESYKSRSRSISPDRL